MDFSSRFLELLHGSGWSPDRRVDIAPMVEPLLHEGYVANPRALDALRSLGGLVVHLPAAGVSPYDHELRFDPVGAAAGELDRAEDWKAQIGVDLFPLGEERYTDAILWSGSDGRVYFGREHGLYLLGDTLPAALDTLAFPPAPLTLCAD